MYVLETICRVGVIVEVSLLAPCLRNPFSAARCWCKTMLFHLSFLLWSYLRQEDKCVIYSFMSPIMEVPLQSELTECLGNARHWLLCMGANLTGDTCWGLRETQSCWRNRPITNSICYVVPSVQFIRSVMSDSLQPHGLQPSRAHCSSPTPGAWANSCPSSWWFHPTISSSVKLFFYVI